MVISKEVVITRTVMGRLSEIRIRGEVTEPHEPRYDSQAALSGIKVS
jgi:hypothetical protein